MRLLILFASAHLLCGQALNIAIVGNGPVRAGNTIQISLSLTGSGGRNIAGLQESIAASTGGTFSVANGPANIAAGKSATCNQVGALYICLDAGLNATAYSDGIVHTYSLQIPANATSGQSSIVLSGLVAATAAGLGIPITGNSITFTLASPISQCDLDGSGITDSADFDLALKEALGLAACSDLSGDGKCTVVDVVRVANAVLGGACKVGT
jgi:hypothetical protein